MSIRDDIRAAMAITAAGKIIPCPAIEGWPQLYVKTPTVAEVDETSNMKESDDGKQRRFARGVCNILCDENGQRIFDANNDDDVKLLAEQPWDMLQKVMGTLDQKGGTDAKGN